MNSKLSKFIFIFNILFVFFLFKKFVFKNKVEKFTNQELIKKIYNVNENLDTIFDNMYSDDVLSNYKDRLKKLDTKIDEVNEYFISKDRLNQKGIIKKIKSIVYPLY